MSADKLMECSGVRPECLLRLTAFFKELEGQPIAVAFSGGVDSTLVLKLADLCTDSLKAFYFVNELNGVDNFAKVKELGAKLRAEVFRLSVPVCPEIMEHNPKDRCFLCKSAMFRAFKAAAKKEGCSVLLDGTNADDLLVYRPGLKARALFEVRSPLAEAGLSKAEVRALAAFFELPNASLPSAPCLATRFEYGARLNSMLMAALQAAEEELKNKLGLHNLRIRVHSGNTLARLEIDLNDLNKAVEQREYIVQRIREIGINYVTLDLSGFRSGSMDEI